MNTQIITGGAGIETAAAILRAGGLVAVPTETVYGLAGNGLDPAAVARIYEVKGRPERKPLSLLVPDAAALDAYCADVPPAARALAGRFWPGPLTIVLRAAPSIPAEVRAGGETVGLRCPDSPQTLALLRASGVPLAAPSANPSGMPSPKSAEEVAAYFSGQIDAIVDGGACALGTESTVVDLASRPWRILRQGALPAEEIRQTLIQSLKIIGVTGGTGCGKTTALDSLAALGALILDADKIYHELCLGCAPMLAEIDARFPGAVEGGTLQRRRLGEIVFSDARALADLRQITDRYVEREIDDRLAAHAAAGGRYAAVDAINILDTALRPKLVACVGVTAPEEVRVQRLMAREGISEEYARLRIAAQPSSAYYEKNCDHIIRNDGTLDDFRRRCDGCFQNLLSE